jgi:hypothetical protein
LPIIVSRSTKPQSGCAESTSVGPPIWLVAIGEAANICLRLVFVSGSVHE